MNKVLEKLLQIKQNPGIYIGEKKITYLAYYIFGYRDREFELTEPIYDSFLMELQDYIHDKYNENANIHLFRTILRFEGNEEKAFDKFYELLDEFLKQNNSK